MAITPILAMTMVMVMAMATTIAMAMALAKPPPIPPLTSYDLLFLTKASLTDWLTE